MPRTGGGTNTCVVASWIWPSRWRSTWAICVDVQLRVEALVEVVEHDEE